MSEAVSQAFRYGKMVLCAASYDGGGFPPMHEFLYKLGIKGYQSRRVGVVENGTWAPHGRQNDMQHAGADEEH